MPVPELVEGYITKTPLNPSALFVSEKAVILLQTQKIDAYPNPMQDELNIVMDDSLPPDASVSIYNAMSHLVFSGHMDELKKVMDVSEWPGGMYVVRVEQME